MVQGGRARTAARRSRGAEARETRSIGPEGNRGPRSPEPLREPAPLPGLPSKPSVNLPGLLRYSSADLLGPRPSLTLAVRIMRLATSKSPWWFWPISAMMKHGCCPPTQRPGHNSSSSGMVLTRARSQPRAFPHPPRRPAGLGPATSAGGRRAANPRVPSRSRANRSPPLQRAGRRASLAPPSVGEPRTGVRFLPKSLDTTVRSTLQLARKDQERAQTMVWTGK